MLHKDSSQQLEDLRIILQIRDTTKEPDSPSWEQSDTIPSMRQQRLSSSPGRKVLHGPGAKRRVFQINPLALASHGGSRVG
jgi:hypothetical protein|uniref:Uncharacterized protein n=1 Tax=Picea glauca TaxID=3330 RepID=A0A117NGE7_PICGL|nr:hypothetical protein ABT39_MTgene1368 [Picea glauca]QHR89479.1 hypothetical protein Q903MT_gene3500 [Picea sitchensis]